jgi:hypothetical protein
MTVEIQEDLFSLTAPTPGITADVTRRALDELFTLMAQYRSAPAYHGLMQFIAKFHFYSPFNAMLIHIQMPGATYVAPPSRWLRDYGRRIKPGARPIAILQPMGPVMFVFDVSDVLEDENSEPLPKEVTAPFETRRGAVGSELERTIENAVRDGIRTTPQDAGSQAAGSIEVSRNGGIQPFLIQSLPLKKYVNIRVRYELLVNRKCSREARYATIVHELAHLYCGHLGSPNPKWWSDSRGLCHVAQEFEAESVCYMICERLGIDNPSEEYLASLLYPGTGVPPISLEAVMTSAGLVERMGRERLKLRKEQN